MTDVRSLILPKTYAMRPRIPTIPRRCLFSTCLPKLSHENPLGLPRSGTPQSKGLPRSGTPPTLPSRRSVPTPAPVPNVGKIILISSAKGGVGKSTVSVNLALALSGRGNRTAILDSDIYGPSLPMLLDLEGYRAEVDEEERLTPLTAYGLKAMSMGFLIDKGTVAWRGLLIQRALRQLLFEVNWPKTDVLLVDTPPGTGDVLITLAQSVKLDGAVVVSTPQNLALRDAMRGLDFLRKTNIPVLGMVQNMASFKCEGCGKVHDVFGLDGVRRKCEEEKVKILGDIPLHSSICASADSGKPTVVAEPSSPQAKAFEDIAADLAKQLNLT
ncbi:P-loop containing nucleoside triphosphate hydrolase protein [Piedraia hortae CBS 480.64]|uniref:P-loop containing nucleoside triphosphate hydrolase protein n=1 Tax=Piedraia hortae CBS 480.64 TaxID=1314780 RepID=A0A6A7BRA9_9PEZI|nr:P-loop containing nucleoside triphosphate hydrolase protein [Piedraia hortae CBS 480.64]